MAKSIILLGQRSHIERLNRIFKLHIPVRINKNLKFEGGVTTKTRKK